MQLTNLATMIGWEPSRGVKMSTAAAMTAAITRIRGSKLKGIGGHLDPISPGWGPT